MHFLHGSPLQGHTKLSALDVVGLCHCFGAAKSPETTSMDTGLHRTTVGLLLDRLRIATTLVAEAKRASLEFEDCQLEANETVVRKERVYEDSADGKRRVGTWHHSVVALTRRGSTQGVAYLCEPKFVPVDDSGKPSPPSLPSVALVLPILSRHLGNRVVLHTDGAEAYSAACTQLRTEGWAVVHDHVVHSQGQYTAFGRHIVTEEPEWAACDFALVGEDGERRIRVEKGTQQVEGLWRHLKHDDSGIPEEVCAHDERLNMYVQVHMWRHQICGDPFQEVMRLCRAFRSLPREKQQARLEARVTWTGTGGGSCTAGTKLQFASCDISEVGCGLG